MKLLATQDWLDRKVGSDPDLDGEAGVFGGEDYGVPITGVDVAMFVVIGLVSVAVWGFAIYGAIRFFG